MRVWASSLRTSAQSHIRSLTTPGKPGRGTPRHRQAPSPGEGQSRGGRSEPRAYHLRHEGARWVLPEVPGTDRTAAAAQHRPRRQRQAPDRAAGGRSPVALRLPRSAFRLRARRHHPLPQRACSSFSPRFAIRSSSRTTSSSSLGLDEMLSCRCGAGWLRRLQSTGSGIGPTAGGRGTGGSLLLARPKGRTRPAAPPACQGQLVRRAGSGGSRSISSIGFCARPRICASERVDTKVRLWGHQVGPRGSSLHCTNAQSSCPQPSGVKNPATLQTASRYWGISWSHGSQKLKT
ncbi:uncharacterized protein LOC144369663 [Ictidomys tridecemlineatus]